MLESQNSDRPLKPGKVGGVNTPGDPHRSTQGPKGQRQRFAVEEWRCCAADKIRLVMTCEMVEPALAGDKSNSESGNNDGDFAAENAARPPPAETMHRGRGETDAGGPEKGSRDTDPREGRGDADLQEGTEGDASAPPERGVDANPREGRLDAI